MSVSQMSEMFTPVKNTLQHNLQSKQCHYDMLQTD